MTRIELRENGDWTPVTVAPADVAMACAAGLLESRVTGPGLQVKPLLNRVGAVSVGHDEFVVHPKAPFSSVLFMLGQASDPGFRPDEVSGTGSEVFPAVAETYTRLLERSSGRGVLQGYRRYDETAVAVRGRIRFSDQMSRRGGQLLPVELTIDDYTADIAENQILRAAARRLLMLPSTGTSTRRRLAHQESRLADASLLRPEAPLPAWRPSRLNERHQPALRFAELVLSRSTPSTTGGDQRIASFVVNMAEAFEGFVTAALTRAFARRSRGVSVAQYPTHLDEERRQPIRPDLVHLVGGIPTAAVDAKYKMGAPRVEDLYQMLAYCSVLGLREGTLVYVAGGVGAPRTATIRGTDVVVRTARLDVSVSPSLMLDQMDRIADQLQDGADQHLPHG